MSKLIIPTKDGSTEPTQVDAGIPPEVEVAPQQENEHCAQAFMAFLSRLPLNCMLIHQL